MGFECFTVNLTPCEGSALLKSQDAGSVVRLAEDIQRHWPSVRPDDVERDEIAQYVQPNDVYLFSETEAGLFQMLLHDEHNGVINISLRFALCNPRTIYEPFCAMVAWLMRRYQLRCRNFSSLRLENSEDFCEPNAVSQILVPSMDENRRLWQLDAGIEEDKRWRPGEALAWFVKMRCVPA